jgi:hypothetical protein
MLPSADVFPMLVASSDKLFSGNKTEDCGTKSSYVPFPAE